MLTPLGLNGCSFDIKPRVSEKIIAPETDEAAVHAIIEKKVSTELEDCSSVSRLLQTVGW